ncbi:MAG: TetR/AcrR family transcriptional regulator [Alphaproteobacteria bacterium]
MPWEKQFDESDVLEKAMQAFWARGFTATSIRDLVDCMGLNRGSIYAAFGDKRGLFLKALQHYETRHRRTWLKALREHHTPRAAILSVFEGAIGTALSDRSRSGCFLVNTAIEFSSHDEEIAQAVAAGLSETETFFRDLILESQRLGEIPSHVDPAHTARTLLGLLTGLRVLARSRPERSLLEALADQAAALLR